MLWPRHSRRTGCGRLFSDQYRSTAVKLLSDDAGQDHLNVAKICPIIGLSPAARGLSRWAWDRSDKLKRAITPVIAYTQNVNGGNPDRPYINRGTPDPALVRKGGLLFGAAIDGNGRKTFRPGQYIDYAFQGSYAQAPAHAVAVKTLSAQFCTKHNVRDYQYMDLCGND